MENSREPSNYEREQIKKYITLRVNDEIKSIKVLMVISIIAFVISIIDIIILFKISEIIYAVLAILIYISCIHFIKRYKRTLTLIDETKISILDCEISKIEKNSTIPGCNNVTVMIGNENKIFRARKENLKENDKLIVAYIKHPINEKYNRTVGFTEFMLSDEGLKYRGW